MVFVLGALAVVLVLGIAFFALGREVGTLEQAARPAVFDLEEAVDFIADGLPPDVAGRLSHDDVRWVLRVDVDLLEDATDDAGTEDEVVDEDAAVARILAAADAAGRELADEDVAAVLAGRLAYLRAIGAVGGPA